MACTVLTGGPGVGKTTLLLESLGMLQDEGALATGELQAALNQFQFHKTVFVLPPRPQIYTQDAERDHSFEHCVRVHQELLRWYQRCGYAPHEVPCLPVAARADHVLKTLEGRARQLLARPARPTGTAKPGVHMPADRFDHLFIEPSSFDAALAFYRDGLGWTELFSWGDGGGPRGVGLSGGGTRLVLAERHPAADHSKSHGINGTRPTLHLAVADLNARYSEIQAKGLALFPPETTHWGTRWFVVKDPDGNLIAFEEGSNGAGP